MKIIKLEAQNVKRITAVEISPEGNLIIVGGKNGAGKSSVLDSIAYALGGKELVPIEPIRQGEREARIVVELEDLIITRTFRRDRQQCDCEHAEGEHHATCASHHFGETRTALNVRNKENASYGSPQAVLDKLFGKLSFDPLAFMRDKNQLQTLRHIANIDTSALDDKRKEVYAIRTEISRQLKVAQASETRDAGELNAPLEEISITELSREVAAGERLRLEAQRKQREADVRRDELANAIRSRDDVRKALEELMQQGEHLNQLVVRARGRVADAEEEVREADKAVPDMEALHGKVEQAEVHNQRVRRGQRRRELLNIVDGLSQQVQAHTATLQQIDEDKKAQTESAKFPIDGLGLHADGFVMWKGIPLAQASTAEQLRVSVAIGLALNPTLKVLLIRDGNSLDSDSLKAVAEQAAMADAQVWLERVTETDEGVSVMIEAGHVV